MRAHRPADAKGLALAKDGPGCVESVIAALA